MNGSTNSSFLLSASVLCRREIVRFLRQRSRIIGALGSPLIFWLLLGSGVGTSFTAGPAEPSYLKYYFPGTVVLILLFTAISSKTARKGFCRPSLSRRFPALPLCLGNWRARHRWP